MNSQKYQLTCAEKKVPVKSEVHKSLQKCGSSVWCLLHFTLLVPGTWRWLVDFGNIYGILD